MLSEQETVSNLILSPEQINISFGYSKRSQKEPSIYNMTQTTTTTTTQTTTTTRNNHNDYNDNANDSNNSNSNDNNSNNNSSHNKDNNNNNKNKSQSLCKSQALKGPLNGATTEAQGRRQGGAFWLTGCPWLPFKHWVSFRKLQTASIEHGCQAFSCQVIMFQTPKKIFRGLKKQPAQYYWKRRGPGAAAAPSNAKKRSRWLQRGAHQIRPQTTNWNFEGSC